ncbi:hypothetical protein M406DRAFT_352518 [Cryphonectria parasitica EP155]|uniref:Uncharacterized protein n=1 Tax=Cryphonectria parasitica (strain ATCC 38755 / EP155) TaxID=660469 RepID=A0A9P5CM83_CRYP1|nr:uncharacterized protein M406DRAFT_352518 [Cryphonectria parasitica EP155]KAF3763848.1 hypothetical protein M406DRAFT_352518 [Cryphonectria parasitica EP155]
MSWVKNAIATIHSQKCEVLHQTVYGGYGTKPDIFWAVDPSDMPENFRKDIEQTLKEDSSSSSTCFIIRIETFPAFEDEALRSTGSPVGCLNIFKGTDPANVEYSREINIYEERPTSPPNVSSQEQLHDEHGAIARTIRRFSLAVGFGDTPKDQSQASSGLLQDSSLTHRNHSPSPDRRRKSIAAPLRTMLPRPQWRRFSQLHAHTEALNALEGRSKIRPEEATLTPKEMNPVFKQSQEEDNSARAPDTSMISISRSAHKAKPAAMSGMEQVVASNEGLSHGSPVEHASEDEGEPTIDSILASEDLNMRSIYIPGLMAAVTPIEEGHVSSTTQTMQPIIEARTSSRAAALERHGVSVSTDEHDDHNDGIGRVGAAKASSEAAHALPTTEDQNLVKPSTEALNREKGRLFDAPSREEKLSSNFGCNPTEPSQAVETQAQHQPRSQDLNQVESSIHTEPTHAQRDSWTTSQVDSHAETAVGTRTESHIDSQAETQVGPEAEHHDNVEDTPRKLKRQSLWILQMLQDAGGDGARSIQIHRRQSRRGTWDGKI